MSFNTILYHGPIDGIVTLTFNRPERKNAINMNVYNDFVECLNRAENDDECCCVVVTGGDQCDYFSSGADLKESIVFDSENKIIDLPVGLFMKKLLRFSKLIICCVNGNAVGIGVTMLLHCDIIYCVNDCQFWVPFYSLGLVPEYCSSRILPEIFGQSKANELLYFSEKINSNDAKKYGLVSEIYPNYNIMMNEVYNKIKNSMSSLPLASKSSKIFKKLIRGPRIHELEQIMENELEYLDQRFQDGDSLLLIGEALSKMRSKL